MFPEYKLAERRVDAAIHTGGVLFHIWHRPPYRIAIRHSFVLAATGCHFVTIAQVLTA
jgi:hemolysin III